MAHISGKMPKEDKRRVLVYDIETSPILSHVWQLYEANSLEVIKDWYMLCFAYKWLGEKKTHVVALPDFKHYKKHPEDDSKVVKKLWELFNEADIVIAHNGDKFDQKKSNARFIQHELLPPEPYASIDTLKVARKYFKFSSNKLDDLGDYLKVGRKVQTGGYSLWQGCMAGDTKAWNKMKRYNKQDVVLLEEVYLKLRPWISNHPAITFGMRNCSNCGHDHLNKAGYKRTKTAEYQRYRCYNCGAYSRERLSHTINRPEVVGL